MNAIALDTLSFESGETFTDEIATKDAITTDVMNPVHEQEFNNMLSVFDTYKTIRDRRYICRADMHRVVALAPTYPALDELVDRYPVNSFTLEPSRVNYDVSMEGFARTAYEAVVKALRDILDFVIRSFKRLWQFMRSDTQRTQAVDDVGSKLSAVQNYIIEVDNVVSGTRFAGDFKRVKEGAFKSESHNVYKWNGLKQSYLLDPEDHHRQFTVLAGVLTDKIPPFVDAVSTFLTSLVKAETAADVDLAIAKMELLDMSSSQLTALVATQGYSTKSVQVNSKMTNFQSMASFLLNVYRSAENTRPPIDESAFMKAVVTTSVVNWSEALNETIRTSTTRTEPLLTRINSFNESSLKVGLEDVYINKLAPFFMSLTSILQGFTALESALGMLVTNRNNVTVSISKAALQIAKEMDRFVVGKKEEFTLAEQSVIWRHRRSLNSKFQ